MKRGIHRCIAILSAVAFTISSASVSTPILMAAADSKTPVLPLTPFSVNGMGNVNAQINQNTNLFIDTDSVTMSSDKQLQGVIAEIPEKDNSVSSVTEVTPMTGGTALTYNSATVTHTYEKVIDLADEKGLKINTVSGGEYEVEDTTASQSYANIAFNKRNSFVGADGVMFYLKLDAANVVAPNFGAFIPEIQGRWTFDYDPVLMLMVGKDYSYKSLNSDTWTTGTAVQDKEGSSYFGAMKFNSAFEGYIKIPFNSLGNDMGFVFNPNLDSLKLMCVKTVGLGGKYGTVTAGPYFVVNKDSTSGKIKVNQTFFVDAPASIGAKISGFKKPLKETDAILVYAKTDSANRIAVSANIWDDYLSDITSLVLKGNEVVYTAALGDSEWSMTKTVQTEADGAIQFEKAFNGYIKIPISSFKEQDASPFISIYPEIDYINGVEITVAGIGGEFGKVEAAPFLINEDKNTTSFMLSDEYTAPVVEATEVVPVLDTALQLSNWQYVNHTEVKPLDYTNAKGTTMEAVDPNGMDNLGAGTSQAYANFKLNSFSMKDYEGIVFYVKLGSANQISPQIALDMPSDSNRWSNAWDPILMLKTGGYYEYMPITGGEWRTGTAVAGLAGNSYYGSAQFNYAFEGYIKIPYSSLFNDSGFTVSTDVDTVKNIVYRTKGLGASYGKVTLGPTFFVSKNGSEGIKLKKADPITVNPVAEWTSLQTAPASNQTVVNPLDWTNADALKLTSETEYSNDYAAHSTAYARSKFNKTFTLGDTTHIIMYVKTDSANVILPRISYSGAELNIGYDAEMTLGVGKSYSYMPIGGDKWISATAVPTWKSGSGDTNGDGISDTYFGGMKFEKAFEGYVKFAVADLSNDYALVNNANRATTKIAGLITSVSNLGGKYGSVIVGPYLLTSRDSDSTEIELYEEPNPNKNVEINAVPVTGTGKSEEIKFEKVHPIKGLTLEGFMLSTEKSQTLDNNMISGSKPFSIESNVVLKNSNGMLIYIKSDRKNVVAPKLIINGSSEFSLGVGKQYMLLSFANPDWTKKKAVKADDSDSLNGGIELTAGFEGYVRIPFTSLVNVGSVVINTASDSLTSTELRFADLGVGENTVTTAPVSLITNNGEGSEIVYPASYNSSNPYERIQGIFERSKLGLTQGNYFMVGDSTRYLYGHPIFRLVRNALKENYNMNCVLQAQSGLKAEHWSNYTPGLDGPSQPTVDQLIEKIPGTGRNCIVDLALGINDSWQSGDKIYEFLIKGINKIREEKPEAVIVYTSPSLISFANQNENMKSAAEKIWQDKSIYKIDVLNNVFADYYSQYYMDTHHPNSAGYKCIAQYIISQYVEGKTFEKIYDVDETVYSLPEKAIPITSTIIISKSLNMVAGIYDMKVNDKAVGSVKLSGTKDCSGQAAFDSDNFIETKLSEPLTGNDYVSFYLKLPAANGIGVRAFKLKDDSEIIFKRDMNYYVMPIGSNEWTEKTAGAGRSDKVETYGSLDFDGAFEGWVKLPLDGFYGSPFSEDKINGVTFRFSELGAKYGEIRVGSFFAISDSKTQASDSYTLPSGAKPIESSLNISKKFNISERLYSMKVNGTSVDSIELKGTTTCTGVKPFNSDNYIETKLSEPLTGNDYVSFYLKLPAANSIGVRAFKLKDDSEIIFKRDMNYSVMPIGSNEWTEKTAGAGRSDKVETYGSLDFDGAFEGWVKLPLKGFYGSPSTSDDINGVTFRFSEVGGKYGAVSVGAFFAISDQPYTAKNVWKKSQLPEMVPFTPITDLDGAPWMYRDYVASPIPSLTQNKALLIGTDSLADYKSPDYVFSSHWVSTAYNNMPLGEYSHLMIYVKTPANKENYLYLEFQTNQGVIQIMANTDYQLLSLGETKYQYCVAERTHNSIGGLILPANFEGFIKIPYSSLAPADAVDNNTLLQKIFYRFSYIGSNDKMVMAGPVFGVTKDNDPGPEKMILTELPDATTIKSLYAIEKGDIFTDRVMLYWEAFDGATNYSAEAYSIKKTDTGFEYELAAKNRCIGTSGVITDLMPGRKYAIVLKAYDLRDKLLAIYDYTTVTTLETEYYASPGVSDKMIYDKVYYKEVSGTSRISDIVLKAVIGSAAVLLLAGAAVVFVIVKKRRKKNV